MSATRTLQTQLPEVFDKSPPRDSSLRASQKVYPGFQSDVMAGSDTCVHPHDDPRSWTHTTWIWIIIVPIIVWFILLLLMPTFVKMSKTNKAELDHSSMLLWTLIISLIIWILFWGFAKCKTC